MFYCVWHSRKASERFNDFVSNVVMFTAFFVMYETFFIYEFVATFNDNLPYQLFLMVHAMVMLTATLGILNTFAIQLVIFKILEHMNYFSDAIKRRPSLSGNGSHNLFISSRVRLTNKDSFGKRTAQHSKRVQENTELIPSGISPVIINEFDEPAAVKSVPV